MATELKSEIKDGISQSERYIASLSTDYVGIDEKTTNDLLKQLCDLSGQFNYYNYFNEIEGDWTDFLTADLDILMVLLSGIDSRSMDGKYKILTDKLQLADDEAELITRLKNIFQFIQNFIRLQISYHIQLARAGNNSYIEEEEEAGRQTFPQQIQKLFHYNQVAAALLGEEVKISFNDEALNFDRDANFTTYATPFSQDGTKREKVIQSIKYFDGLMADLDKKYTGLLNRSKQYIQKQNHEGDVYEPHVALLLSFLNLYSYLQKPINGLLQKHLDYFYKDIIGMKNRAETPDRLHIIVDPAPGSHTFTLNTGEELVAEIEGYQEKLIYTLDNSVEISQTQIKEIKTVFISNKLQLRDEKSAAGNINELQVYKGDYPAPLPAAFQNNQLSAPWPLLGEDQSVLPQQLKTMEDADMGLVIASPLFYQADGERLFMLKFFINKESFLRFEAHAQRMSLTSALNKEILIEKMLNQAFNITITGAAGWMEIKRDVVSYSKMAAGNNDGHYIEIAFTMDSKTEATAVYDSAIHGLNLDLQWPVVRLLLNNSAFHHPYTFLSYFIIERFEVKIDVKKSTQFQLKNDQGEIYAGLPFQPFGTIPARRSYLDIKNTNIFNRYTTSFSLGLNWFDLPEDENGFAGYYAGYDAPFTNESFKVKLSSDQHLQHTDVQEEYNLFACTTNHNKEYLKDHTVISVPDLSGLRFENAPEMDRDEPMHSFRQGTLRMELTGPAEAFGSRLYTQAFIAAAEHNSKRFGKKRAVPNTPYVPVLNQLTIDYTLEHSELTSGSAQGEEEEVIMVHLYPFGYDKFYTGKNAKDNYFVPQPRHESNLYLGLNTLAAGQELSILFQLSEENFHHSVHQPEPINWSHLVNNLWVDFPAPAILLDTTNKFVSTGIVTLKIPDGIEKNNTILNPDLYWIRASLAKESALKSRTIAIFTQAVAAVRKPGQLVFPDYTYVSPPGTVKGFCESFPAIREIKQLFSSVGGHPKESDRQYNTRVSERLRHKQRFLSIQDISQAVLDTFPQILMVKCYNTEENAHMILPGADINLIVIPKEREDGGFTSQEPKVTLSLLYGIKEFLSRSVSDFIRVEVGNPIYERVKVVAKIKFRTINEVSHSNGYYLKLINQDIKKYISAWLYDPKCDFKMGAELYVLAILNHLQNLPYVDYITEFSLIHFFSMWDRKDKSFHAEIIDTSIHQKKSLKGSVPGAILISANEHQLTVISETKNEKPVNSGIGDFLIGSDLLIFEQKNNNARKKALPPAEGLQDFTVYHQ